ncbi:hypothetical protein ESA94_18215 [Lacibacter luteus]|uniref:DUF4890 domain-containing protein n=1 Tax=Lacibacter luteus TaxID=2508719 RepID=A0A4Q1CFZ0_9BACT|nr:hypothetical protein [Lacibacter luteus]RXK58567.1 hypothetical protein ESA94_18215 [Lacibacter luteus]
MKLKFVLFIFMLFSTGVLISQSKQTADKKSYKTLAKQEAAMLKQQLNLTQKQAIEIEAVELEYMEKRRAIGAQSSLPISNRGEELSKIAAWRKEMYQKILSNKQYEDYQNLLLRRKNEYNTKNQEIINRAKQKRG